MTGPDLKPCPFCGSKNIGWAWRSTYSIDSSYAFFGCLDCRMGSDEASEDNALDPCDAAAWNRRATDQATLPEVQALIAAAYEVAVGASVGLVNSRVYFSARARKDDDQFAQAIRNLTPSAATAALARIEREAEARGRVKGLREAAEMFHEEQVRIWAEEILSSLALEGILSFGTYDKKVTAYVSVSNEINGISSAILARADQIEKDAK